MQWFRNLRTSVKLISAFLLVSVLTVTVGYFGLNGLKKTNGLLDGMYSNNLKPVTYVSDALSTYQRIRINIRDMNTTDVRAEKDEKAEKINGFMSRIEEGIQKYKDTELTEQEEQLLGQFPVVWQEYLAVLEEAKELAYAEEAGPFNVLLMGDLTVSGNKVSGLFDELMQVNTTLANQRFQEGIEQYDKTRWVLIICTLVAVVFSIALGIIISRMISVPLGRVVKLVGKVESGDLTETTKVTSKDEIGQLTGSVNSMVLSLRSTVEGVMLSAENVASASQQISASTEEVAAGSEEQANATQSIHELFGELTSAMYSVAKTAEQASELAGETMSIARQGGDVIKASVDGMNVINEQVVKLEQDSNQIGEIIDVIDDIAEQTNLLALNAAIEAARAGDQGRGFAVVADEVRKLAERSGEATKQITLIIKGMQENTRNSVKAAHEGAALSGQTGEAFDRIISKVNESVDRVNEIAAASEQQAAQSTEVLTAVQSISAVTEEAASSSEETAATARSLADLAEELNQVIFKFKVK
ncbi:methyl-accepting chemotaxis protein [Paenibacillus lemnae]|uniref:Methyl-accepting chemotaxis protein n=1 Tax=Paenibacillus lemnae TaxID=1330551 RepID=A0A848M4M7_PAELE|nr:methyl-accepting chemotaxis protein [Paenibacillus lemnae]NMO95180.1 methyl-accepting chemotaxis protein [Paenibacillus lemnae]